LLFKLFYAYSFQAFQRSASCLLPNRNSCFFKVIFASLFSNAFDRAKVDSASLLENSRYIDFKESVFQSISIGISIDFQKD